MPARVYRPTRTQDEFCSTIMMSNMSLKEEMTVCPVASLWLLLELPLLAVVFDVESLGEDISSLDLRCFIKHTRRKRRNKRWQSESNQRKNVVGIEIGREKGRFLLFDDDDDDGVDWNFQ